MPLAMRLFISPSMHHQGFGLKHILWNLVIWQRSHFLEEDSKRFQFESALNATKKIIANNAKRFRNYTTTEGLLFHLITQGHFKTHPSRISELGPLTTM